MRTTSVVAGAVIGSLVVVCPQSGWSWNDMGHRKTIEKAVDVLPKAVKDFYKGRRNALMERVTDPARVEPRVVFEVDRLEAFPFDHLPTSREEAVSRYGEEKLAEAGDLPWRIIETFQKLTEAFRAMDVSMIEARSVEIAYYVGEMHVPLNLSKDGDGEPTGQYGLRERLDGRLLEIFLDDVDVKPDAAIYLDRPGDYAVSIAPKVYVWADNLLLADYLSNRGTMSYDRFYFDGLWRRSADVIALSLSRTSEDMASFWYTAWVDAGKPKLPRD